VEWLKVKALSSSLSTAKKKKKKKRCFTEISSNIFILMSTGIDDKYIRRGNNATLSFL
jgi:glycosylphosphatidylinositol transamidase (GPIT) subunit GPI8